MNVSYDLGNCVNNRSKELEHFNAKCALYRLQHTSGKIAILKFNFKIW